VLVRAVIFDFDGPINDSFREGLRRIGVLAAVYNVQFGRVERKKLTELWGIPGKELLIQGLGVSSGMAEEMYTAWERLDLQNPVPLVPGADKVLYWLGRNGFARALLTTRNEENVLDIFEKLDLLRKFEILSTRQDTPDYRKPDPRAFEYVLNRLTDMGVAKEECIFIGDTPVDIMAGNAAGIETLVVQTGPYLLKHAAAHPVKLANVLNSVDDLPGWLEENQDGELRYPYE